MIYFIGGTPRSGKTTVAKGLAARLDIPWISADTLEGLAKHFAPSEQYSKRFPKDVLRKETRNSNDLMYSRYTAEQIKKAYVKQAKSSWEVIETLVDCLIGEDYDFIIEGHQAAPKLVARLKKKFGNKVTGIFLTRHLVKNIVEDAKESTAHDDWFIKKTKDVSVYPKIASMIAKYGDYLKNEAKKYNFRVVDMDRGFHLQVSRTVRYLKGLRRGN